MATYITLSHIAPDAIKDPKDLKGLAETVAKEIKQRCPGVKWKDSFATIGRFDVVEAPDSKEVERAAMIIRSRAHSSTEATRREVSESLERIHKRPSRDSTIELGRLADDQPCDLERMRAGVAIDLKPQGTGWHYWREPAREVPLECSRGQSLCLAFV
jgi:uncharacterized protein with GYD domain